MRHLRTFCLASLIVVAFVAARGFAAKPTLGFVSLTTTQEGDRLGSAERFAPDVLVGFTRADRDRRIFAMTDQSGTAIVPLEPGSYCAEAFGLDGKPIQLTPRSLEKAHSCFALKADTTMEFSITIVAGASYSKKLPRLSVQ